MWDRTRRGAGIAAGYVFFVAWIGTGIYAFLWVVGDVRGNFGSIPAVLLAGGFFAAATVWVCTRDEGTTAPILTEEERLRRIRRAESESVARNIPPAGWRLARRRILIGLGVAAGCVWFYLVVLGPTAKERCEDSGGRWVVEATDPTDSADSYCEKP